MTGCASSQTCSRDTATSRPPCSIAATTPAASPCSTISPTEHGVKLVATNDVHYHVPERRALQDVVTAIRLGCTVEELGFRRFASAERHLKEPAEMARLFRRYPHAIAHTQEIVKRCSFSLRHLTYQYPVLYEGGETPMDKLMRLTWEGADWRYPEGVPEKGDRARSGRNSRSSI